MRRRQKIKFRTYSSTAAIISVTLFALTFFCFLTFANLHLNAEELNAAEITSDADGKIPTDTPVPDEVYTNPSIPITMYDSAQITTLNPDGYELNETTVWTTSDPYVAYVSNGNEQNGYVGKVTAISPGTATITATTQIVGNIEPTKVSFTINVEEDVNSPTSSSLQKIVYMYEAGNENIPNELLNLGSGEPYNGMIMGFPEELPNEIINELPMPQDTYQAYIKDAEGAYWMVSNGCIDYTIGSETTQPWATSVSLSSKVSLEGQPVATVCVPTDSLTYYNPNAKPENQIQFLQGGRYIPQTGESQNLVYESQVVDGLTTTYNWNSKEEIQTIMSDGNGGIWILGTKGNANHVAVKKMSDEGKASLQNCVSRTYNDRYGFQSGSATFASTQDAYDALMYNDTSVSWSTSANDNDGLWTAMYTAGEIWRYNYFNATYGADDLRTKDAYDSMIRSVEAMTLLGYVSGTQLKVPSSENVNDPIYIANSLGANVTTTEEAQQWFVVNEGKPVYVDSNGHYTIEYDKNYSPAPSGFISRSYLVDGANNGSTTPDQKQTDAAWMQKEAGVTTDVNGTSVPYSEPVEVTSGNDNIKAYDTVPVPERLTETYRELNPNDAESGDLDSSDVYYKATTSTDELVGHYFVLDLAYETLKDSTNPEDIELAALIKNDLINHANAVIINNYYQVGVNGENAVESRFGNELPGNGLNAPSAQTRWGNMNPEFLDGNTNAWGLSDYEDGPLNATLALQLLMVVDNMGGYTDAEREALANQGITNPAEPLDYANELEVMFGHAPANNEEITTHNDYETRYPKTEHSTSLLDMMKQYHSRYFGIAEHGGNGVGAEGVSYEAYLNYSDEEEIALSGYTMSKYAYKYGEDVVNDVAYTLNQWWYNMKREKNPFLTTFTAVSYGYLYANGYSGYIPEMDLAGAKWQWQRTPNILMNYDVLAANRNDVSHDTPYMMVDDLLPKDEVKMSKYNNNIFGTMDRRTVDTQNSLTLESGTVTTLPYWMVVDPTNQALLNNLPEESTKPINNGTESLVIENLPSQCVLESETIANCTINVGEYLIVDANATGYIQNVSWVTDSWGQMIYSNGDATSVAGTNVIDLRTLDDYKDVAGIDSTGLSTNGENYAAIATGLKPGTTTITGYTVDGINQPKKVTFNVTVVDPTTPEVVTTPTTHVDENSFAYPQWLRTDMANPELNTEGNPYVKVTYSSSNEEIATVDQEGNVTINSPGEVDIYATVEYSATTLNGVPQFETNSHVMTFTHPIIAQTNTD